jgi:hypothetical protein
MEVPEGMMPNSASTGPLKNGRKICIRGGDVDDFSDSFLTARFEGDLYLLRRQLGCFD